MGGNGIEARNGVAVVGSSGHAARVATPVIAAADGTRLVGVLGSTRERGLRLAQLYDGCSAYGSLGELTRDPEVDAVWVAGPNAQHVEVAAACLRAGKHVLVEKPMATRLDEAEELCAVAAETGLTLTVGFQHRFRPGHRWMHDAIRDGLVGRVCLVRVQRFWPFPYFPEMSPDPALSWRTSLEESGGWVLNDIGAHLIDLATWLVGSPTRLAFSRTANFRFEDAEAEDTAVLLLDADDGAAVVIETSNAMSSFPGTVEVHGTEGWMRGDGTFDGDGVVVTHRGDHIAFTGVTADRVYLESFRDFLGAIHGEPMAGATAEDGAANVAIVEAAARARTTG